MVLSVAAARLQDGADAPGVAIDAAVESARLGAEPQTEIRRTELRSFLLGRRSGSGCGRRTRVAPATG